MGAKRIKTSRKVVETKTKTGERPAEEIAGFKGWLEARQQTLTVVAASLFVLLLVGWGVNTYLGKREKNAQADYFSAVKDWPSDEKTDPKVWESIDAGLHKVISTASGTLAAYYAQMDLMRAFLQQNRMDEVAKLAASLAAKVDTQKEVRPLMRYQLALTYDALGKADEAFAQWTALKLEPLSGIEREVDWRLGRIHAAKKEYDKAVELYEAALKDPGEYPSLPQLQEDLVSAKDEIGKAS